MNPEKRVLLAMLLSTLVFGLYYGFFYKAPPLPVEQNQNSSQTNMVQQQVVETTSATSASPNNIPANTELASMPAVKEETAEIEHPLYQAQFSNLGATLKSFKLKNYSESLTQPIHKVDLFKGEGLDSALVKLNFNNLNLPKTLAYSLVKNEADANTYQFENDQIKILQTFRRAQDSYLTTVELEVQNKGNQNLEFSPSFKMTTPQNEEHHDFFSFLKGAANLKYPVLFYNQAVERHYDVRKLAPESQMVAPFQWVALEDRYFLWALISTSISNESKARYGHDGNFVFMEYEYPKTLIAQGESVKREFKIYLGPKDIDQLTQLNVSLEKSVDYGWLTLVAQPILIALKAFYKILHNWGLAIIALTLSVKLLLHPINKKSLDSMKAMQKMQPKLAEIREKYKNDKERLNVEMMNLFKVHKINPMGGCLPMLLQMPVYFALYKVLYNSIELYQAPFFGYLKDLSAPDPYFISPVLLGIFMVIQQKLTPAPSQDPAQARMMMFMPILFSSFMLFLPSGLVLYIFVNTLMTVVQQYMHKHDLSLADIIRKIRSKK